MTEDGHPVLFDCHMQGDKQKQSLFGAGLVCWNSNLAVLANRNIGSCFRFVFLCS